MSTLRDDLRYTFRMLRKSPGCGARFAIEEVDELALRGAHARLQQHGVHDREHG